MPDYSHLFEWRPELKYVKPEGLDLELEQERFEYAMRQGLSKYQVCMGNPPWCTELLYDPIGVLKDKRRWPSHICYESFTHWSTDRWSHEAAPMTADGNGILRGSSAVYLWRSFWPLLIGRKAVRREKEHFLRSDDCFDDFVALLDLVPFQGDEEALWALRVEKDGTVLDLFGLAAFPANVEIKKSYIVTWDGADEDGGKVLEFETDDRDNKVAVIRLTDDTTKRVPIIQLELHRDEAPLLLGELAYVLRGQEVSLFDLVLCAKRWWAGFSGQPIGSGRPRDSGAFSSADDFQIALEHRGENNPSVQTFQMDIQEPSAGNITAGVFLPSCSRHSDRRVALARGQSNPRESC